MIRDETPDERRERLIMSGIPAPVANVMANVPTFDLTPLDDAVAALRLERIAPAQKRALLDLRKLQEQYDAGRLMAEEFLDECRTVLDTLQAQPTEDGEDEYEVSCVRIETATSPEHAVEQTESQKWTWEVTNLRTQEVTEVER